MNPHPGPPPPARAWHSSLADARPPAIFLALLIPLALGIYFAVTMTSVNAQPGETGLAAESLLASGVIANPYSVPTGPTAHVSPLNVVSIAAVYGLCGGNSPAARLVLSLVCLGAYVAGAASALLFCRRARLGAAAQGAGVLLTCFLPFQLFTAVISLRQWDQPFAALILMGSLLVATDPHLLTRRRYGPEAVLAGLTGLAALTSPSAMPTPLVMVFVTLWKRSRLRDLRAAALAAAIVAAMIVPWGVRNQAELGRFIVTRSNFGLELAVGNRDGATGRSAVVPAVHPHDSRAAAQHMAAIGETAFMAEKSAEAKSWIAAHPLGFIRLTMTRLRLLLLPDGSIVSWNPLLGGRRLGLLLTAFGVLRLLALALIVLRRRPVTVWLVHCGLPLLPYLFTHVNARYEYPVLFTSICLICTGVELCRKRARRQSGAAAPSLQAL